VFTDLIIAVAAGLIIASLVFMKKVSDLTERQTTLTPVADEPWVDEWWPLSSTVADQFSVNSGFGETP
jgi:hypothetical protein